MPSKDGYGGMVSMKILNSTEAFAAMMAGKDIQCRAVGELIEFNNIDQFPATIFAKPGYEFCVEIETMELAGITFTQPLTIDEIQDGQDVFTINTYGQSIYISEFGKQTCSALIDSINSGFVQHDAENAKLQLKAISKALGRELSGECLVVRLGAEKSKNRVSTKTKTKAAANDASALVEKKTFEIQPKVQIIEQGPITAVEDSLTEEFIETDAVKLVENFTAQIAAADTEDAVMRIRHQLSANSYMVRGQIIELNKLSEARIEALSEDQLPNDAPTDQDPVALSHTVKSEYMLSLTKATQLNTITTLESQINKDSRITDIHACHLHSYIEIRRRVIIEENTPEQPDEDLHEHQDHLNELLNDVASAQTPIEANALVRYTKSWTAEQRKPLLIAINNRLVELNKVKLEGIESPSLMVQIQNAPDLTALDVLEIDVDSCHPDIQTKLMGYVKNRRFELENGIEPTL